MKTQMYGIPTHYCMSEIVEFETPPIDFVLLLLV